MRCSGEKPVCKRCTRLKRTCTYPSDVSSELPLPSTENPPRSSASLATHHHHRHQAGSSGSKIPPLQAQKPSHGDSVPISPTQEHYLGVPAALLSNLIDVFFSHIYNASLLLHKPLLLESIASKSARPHVVLSVCAFAGVYYSRATPTDSVLTCAISFFRDHNNQTSLLDNGFCKEWAERAGTLLFQEVECPYEENIVSFTNLCLFWYGRGDWRRAFIHKGNPSLHH